MHEKMLGREARPRSHKNISSRHKGIRKPLSILRGLRGYNLQFEKTNLVVVWKATVYTECSDEGKRGAQSREAQVDEENLILNFLLAHSLFLAKLPVSSFIHSLYFLTSTQPSVLWPLSLLLL